MNSPALPMAENLSIHHNLEWSWSWMNKKHPSCNHITNSPIDPGCTLLVLWDVEVSLEPQWKQANAARSSLKLPPSWRTYWLERFYSHNKWLKARTSWNLLLLNSAIARAEIFGHRNPGFDVCFLCIKQDDTNQSQNKHESYHLSFRPWNHSKKSIKITRVQL